MDKCEKGTHALVQGAKVILNSYQKLFAATWHQF